MNSINLFIKIFGYTNSMKGIQDLKLLNFANHVEGETEINWLVTQYYCDNFHFLFIYTCGSNASVKWTYIFCASQLTSSNSSLVSLYTIC